MLKKQYLLIAAALITGTALGFMDIFLFGGKAESSVEAGKSAFFSQMAPRFMGKQTKIEISQITPSLSNMSVLIPHYAAMSAEELKAEIKRLQELSAKARFSDDAVNFAIRYLLLRLGRDFPGDLSSYIDNGMDNTSEYYAGALLCEWAKNDFDGAMENFMKNRIKLGFSTDIFKSMVRKLTVDNPEKAMEWGFAQKGKVRQKALLEIFNVFVNNQREKMAEFAERLLPEDLKKGSLLADISRKWGSCDSESAMRWADSLSGTRKKEAIVEILGGLGSVDLEKATAEFKKQAREYQEEIAKTLVHNLAYNKEYIYSDNPSGRKQALDWIQENAPAGEDMNKLTRNLLGNSIVLTPDFLDHVKKMPDGFIRDNALRSMANMTSHMAEYGKFSYQDAFALTDQIKDAQTKKESVLDIVPHWISDDPASARVWIEEKSGFTQEEKQENLKACEKSLKRKKENPQKKREFSQGMIISVDEP